jgi:hypothetical protein
MDEVSAEANDPTATPARIKFVVESTFPNLASLYTIIMVKAAPTNAATGMEKKPSRLLGQLKDMARTAPSPAPEATPIKYGSARGFWKSPW